MLRIQDGIQLDKFYPPADWKDNNNNWIDIRKGAEDNTITVLYGVKSGAYSLFGFLVNVSSGTYDVYIDNIKVGDSITANTQYDIDFDNITTNYGTATTPEALVLHKVVIKPTTSGATITTFSCRNTAGTTNQVQCVLWLHFELSNSINVSNTSSNISSLMSITAKNNYIKSGLTTKFILDGQNIVYLPFLEAQIYINYIGNMKKIKRLFGKFTRYSSSSISWFATNSENLEKIVVNDTAFQKDCLTNCYKLKLLPNTNAIYNCNNNFQNASSLYPTKIDFSDRNSMTECVIKGSVSYPITNLKGLKVSSSAPFSGASPQINISYTGLDRDALVELFQSLPTVTGTQTLSCVGATGTADLTEADKQIATDKGWGLTLS